MPKPRTLTHADRTTWLETLWEALQTYRAFSLTEGDPAADRQWDDLCTAMAWISEDLGIDDPARP